MRKVSGFTVVAVILLAGAFAVPSAATGAQTDTTIGVDVDVDGNSATSIDTVESCIAVGQGETFAVDVYVAGVEDLLAWETYIAYDSAVVQVVDRDVQMFQAADPGSAVFDGSEDVPDNDDGYYRLQVADTRDPPVGDSGSGVLARLTLKALSAGTTSLSMDPKDIIGDAKADIGMTLTDLEGAHIGDSDGDSFFDGSISVPDVFVDVPADRDCSRAGSTPASDPGQRQTPTDDDGGGDWWIIAPIAGAVLGLAVALVYAARRLHRKPTAGAGGA